VDTRCHAYQGIDRSPDPDTPVFVSRYDGHMALANSVTLRLAGITAQTPDPPGGVIVHDAQGNPTGALKRCGHGLCLQDRAARFLTTRVCGQSSAPWLMLHRSASPAYST